MRVLFDTSAMYKRYDNEPGRARVISLAEQADEVCVAAHCKLEGRRRRHARSPGCRRQNDHAAAYLKRSVVNESELF